MAFLEDIFDLILKSKKMKTHYHFHLKAKKSSCIHIHLNQDEVTIIEKSVIKQRFLEGFFSKIKKYIEDENSTIPVKS